MRLTLILSLISLAYGLSTSIKNNQQPNHQLKSNNNNEVDITKNYAEDGVIVITHSNNNTSNNNNHINPKIIDSHVSSIFNINSTKIVIDNDNFEVKQDNKALELDDEKWSHTFQQIPRSNVFLINADDQAADDHLTKLKNFQVTTTLTSAEEAEAAGNCSHHVKTVLIPVNEETEALVKIAGEQPIVYLDELDVKEVRIPKGINNNNNNNNNNNDKENDIELELEKSRKIHVSVNDEGNIILQRIDLNSSSTTTTNATPTPEAEATANNKGYNKKQVKSRDTGSNSFTIIYQSNRLYPLVPLAQVTCWSLINLFEYHLLSSFLIFLILAFQVIRAWKEKKEDDDDNAAADSDTDYDNPSTNNATNYNSKYKLMEKLFFIVLTAVFFFELSFFVALIFRDKYGPDPSLDQFSFDDVKSAKELADKLNLEPITSRRGCFEELIEKRSASVFCLVRESFGKEIIERYGRDGHEKMLGLLKAIEIGTNWRLVRLDPGVHLESFNRAQLRLFESGLLDKWREQNEARIIRGFEKMSKTRPNGWRKKDNEKIKARRFAYHLMLMMFNGLLIALTFFVVNTFVYKSVNEQEYRRQLYAID